MCLWLEKWHRNQTEKNPLPSGEEYLNSLTQRCTESLSTSAVLKLQTLPSTLTLTINKRGWPRLWAHLSDTNMSLHAITHRTKTVGAAFLFSFLFLTILYRRKSPLSGVPCQSVTFSVPSTSSCRFLCHLCTTHFSCILSEQSAPLLQKKGFGDRIAIIVRDMGMNTKRLASRKDLRI